MRRTIWIALALALTSVVMAAAASSGSAVTLPPSLGTPLSDTEQLVDGTAGDLFSTISGGLCSTTGGLASKSGLLGSLLGPTSTLVCELQFLQFDFHTVYRAPDGHMVVLDHMAVPEVPTLIDINGDGLPDALATVYLSSANAVTLQITKLPTAPATMPAEVELVIRDPANPSSSERIAAGYNALSSTAPQDFKATLSLLGISPLQLGLNVSDTNPGSDLALVGSLYSQQPGGGKQVIADASLDYAPVPAALGYQLLLASQHQHVTATASSPATVTAHVALNDGSDSQTIDGKIDQIPSQVDVDVINQSATQRQATYNASAAIGHLDVVYQDATANPGGTSQINTQITGHITSLPTGVQFQQTAARVFSVTTSGGAIGTVDGGFASGEPVYDVPGSGSGAYVKAGSGLLSAAVRLNGLSSANVDLSDPYKVDLVSASQPLQITDLDGDAQRQITAQVDNLPAHLTLSFDPDHEAISENGYGQSISEIDAAVKSQVAIAGPIKDISANLTGIPASFNLNYTTGNGAFTANLDNPIGQVQMTADDGSHTATPVPGNDSGITFVDKPNDFTLAADVYGLQSVKFNSKPMDVAATTAAGHVWNVSADYQASASVPEIKATGIIDQMPSTAEVKLVPDAADNKTDVIYTGSSQINHIGLDATQPGNPFIGDADHVHVDAYSIPQSMDATVVQDPDGSFVATVDHPVHELDFSLDNGSDAQTVPGSDSGLGVLLKATTVPATPTTPKSLKIDTLSVAGRIFGLSRVSYDPNPETVEVDSDGGHTFNFAADATLDGDHVTATGLIDKLPSRVEAEVEPGSDGLSDIVYNASDAIGHVGLDTNASKPFFGTVTHVKADIYKVPADFVLNLDNKSDGGIAVNMNNPADEVDMQMDDGNTPVPAAGNDSWAHFVDSNGHFGVAARVFGVTKFSFDPSPISVAVDSAGGHHFDYAGTMDAGTTANPNPVTFTGSISTLPSSVSAQVDPLPDGNSAIIYKANSSIDEATVDLNSTQPLFDQVTHINADITKIPAEMTMEVGYNDGKFTAETDNTPQEVKLLADSGTGPFTPTPYVYGEDGQQIQNADGSVVPDLADGVAANMTSSGEAFAAQIYGLKTLDLDMTPAPGQQPDSNGDKNLALHVNAADGHELYATVHQSTDNGQTEVPQLELGAFVRDMPSDFGFSQTSSDASGSDIKYFANESISQLKVHLVDSTHPLVATSDDLYSEIQGLPATEPDGPIEIYVPSDGTPQVKFVNQGASGPRTINRLVFELLPSGEAQHTDNFFSQPLDLPKSEQPLPYPNLQGDWTGNETGSGAYTTVSNTVTAAPNYNSGAQTDPNADGLYLRVNTSNKLDGQGNPIPNPPPATGDETQLDKFVVAAAISGLRQGSFDAGPPVTAKLDVNPAIAQPFGFDVEVEGPTPGPTVEGFINSLPSNMQLSFNSNPDVSMNYSADPMPGSTVSISEMHLFAQNVGVPQMDLDIKNIPAKLDVCLAPSPPNNSADCLPQPFPSGVPNELTGVDYKGNSYDEFAEHSVVANFDDEGTSDNGPPMTVNGYICTQGVPQTFGDPMGGGRTDGDCAPPLPGPWYVPNQNPPVDPQDDPNGNSNFFNGIPNVVKIDDLTFHKLFVDVFGTVCDAGKVCFKSWLDTGNLPASGDVYYVSSSLANGGWAGLLMPDGFTANNAYFMLHDGLADLPAGTVNYVAGTSSRYSIPGSVSCPANQYGFLGIHAHVNGLGTANANLYPNVCDSDG